MPRVVAAGLGPAGPELLTAATLDAIGRIPARYLRTTRHPAATAVAGAPSFDHLYDELPTLGEVYRAIVDELVAAAGAAPSGEVLYLVPGSPAVAEHTVELLRQRAAAGDIDLDVLPALSFLDLAWVRLGVDPLAAGVRVVDGHRFAVEAAGERGPLLVAQCDTKLILSDVKLAAEGEAVVLHHLGLPDEVVAPVPWADLDRTVEPDHLTSLYLPSLAAPVAQELVRFDELVRTLRERCPWDREQTHQSLARYLIEETYEAVEAIEGLGPDGEGIEHLEEELGDVLFQVVFHATLGAEEGLFTLADVARTVHDKLVTRHPHVFGTVEADTPDQVVANWDAIKRGEKGRESALDGIPKALPSLLHAQKVQRRAASIGFDWPSVAGAYDKVAEELVELQDDPGDDELGDLLFAVVNVARHLGVDAESALRAATAKFSDRFRAVERLAGERGIDVATADLATLDRLWDDVKAAGAGS